MKQSEIYAHFMANKMGMSEELKEAKADALEAEKEHGYKRADVDEANARRRMAEMINDDKKRLRDFDHGEAADQPGLHESQHDEVDEADLDINQFDQESPAKAVEAPSIMLATLKNY